MTPHEKLLNAYPHKTEVTYSDGELMIDAYEHDVIGIAYVEFEEIEGKPIKGDWLTPDTVEGGKTIEEQIHDFIYRHIDRFEIQEP